MKKRREMKATNDPIEMIHYAELNKTIRKAAKEDIQKFNQKLIEKTIENN
jgi:hypothetical protein